MCIKRILLLSLFISPGSAQAFERFGDIEVSVVDRPSVRSSHGYAEIRLSVANHSQASPHVVSLSYPDLGLGMGFFNPNLGTIVADRSLTVRPASQAEVSLFIPPTYGNRMSVSIDGQRQESGISLTLQHAANTRHLCVLMSRSVTGDFPSRVKEELDSRRKSNPSGYPWATSIEVEVSGLDPSDWNGNWLSFSRYDAILMTNRDLESVPAAVRSAIFAHTELGGTLLITGPTETPKQWAAVASSALGEKFFAGFGEFWILGNREFGYWKARDWDEFFKAASRSQQPWQQRHGYAPNQNFPVVEDLYLPARELFFVVLLFTVVIGPLNLWALHRLNKKILLFVTVPVISVISCAAILAVGLYTEGFRSELRATAFVLLNEPRREARILGLTGIYSTLRPASGLHFSPRTELTPWTAQYTSHAGSINWTKGQQLSGGWVQPRLPFHFRFRNNRLQRERLMLGSPIDDSLPATNALGATIRKIWYLQKGRVLWVGGPAKPGETFRLRPSNLKLAERPEALREIYGSPWPEYLNRPDLEPTGKLLSKGVLKEGTYLAHLQNVSWLEEGLLDAKTTRLEAVVLATTEGVGADIGN